MNSEVLGPQRSLLKDTSKFLGSHLNRKCTNPTFCQIQKILTKVANLRLPKYKLDIGVIAMQGRDRILIIEDDPAVGGSLRDSLTSNADFMPNGKPQEAKESVTPRANRRTW